jgi:hypothetical protein
MRKADPMDIKNAYIFYAASAVVIGYIVYMMIRRRKGERAETTTREPEL